jgi:hypothetical protein
MFAFITTVSKGAGSIGPCLFNLFDAGRMTRRLFRADHLERDAEALGEFERALEGSLPALRSVIGDQQLVEHSSLHLNHEQRGPDDMPHGADGASGIA